MVVRNDLHGLLNQLVSLVLQLLSVSVLSGINTATEVVVLRCWRRGSLYLVSYSFKYAICGINIPVAVGWYDIVDSELLANFLNSEMEGICFELFTGHICHDCGRKSHEACSFVVGCIAPAVSLFAGWFSSIGIWLWTFKHS